MGLEIGFGLAALGLVTGTVWLWKASQSATTVRGAISQFRLRREMLEAKFFDLASQLGKPRGLRWKHCEWKEEVRFARDLETDLLTAFVGVEIHFEAIEGGDMEDIEAVGHFREASAVFHWQNGNWGTGGKALFNMPPAMAVDRLQGQFEPVSVS
ncbi:MAG: hypothetical protein KDA80_02660 [Planctomycetaceae bacterium]|nr:hypothetical protein [Planctomycetaceae bacterium]